MLSAIITFFASAAGRQVFGLMQSVLDNRRVELMNQRKFVEAQTKNQQSSRNFFSSNPIWNYIAGICLFSLLCFVQVPTKVMPYFDDAPVQYVYTDYTEGGSFLFWSWGAGQDMDFKVFPKNQVVLFDWEILMLAAGFGWMFGAIKRR